MPFSSTPSSAFNIMPSVRPQTSGIADSFRNNYKTPNLFDTIQAVRNNELDRQVKQAQIAKFLVDIQSAPVDLEVKRAELANKLATAKYYDQYANAISNNGLELNSFSKNGPTFKKPTTTTIDNKLTNISQDATPDDKNAWLAQNFSTPEISLINKVASGDIDPKTIPAFKGGNRLKYLQAVTVLNPDYNQMSLLTEANFRKDLGKNTPNSVGGQITSANTLIGHLGFMKDKLDELKTGKIPAKNAIVLFAQQQLGHPEVTNFNEAKSVVDSEMERLLTGVGVTQQGLAAKKMLLNQNSSYDQIYGAIKTMGKILESRTGTLEKRYVQNTGESAGDNILFPESRNVLKRLYSSDKNKTASSSFEIVGVRNE